MNGPRILVIERMRLDSYRDGTTMAATMVRLGRLCIGFRFGALELWGFVGEVRIASADLDDGKIPNIQILNAPDLENVVSPFT